MTNKPFWGDIFIPTEFLNLKEIFGIKTVIETGTYKGDTTAWLADNFDEVISIEIDKELHKAALNRFAGNDKVVLMCGDSSLHLPVVLRLMDSTPIIFLDAHWGKDFPLFNELKAIRQSGIKPVLIIHDFYNENYPLMAYDTHLGYKLNWETFGDDIAAIYGEDGFVKYYNHPVVGGNIGCLFVIPNTDGATT